jgi:PilZ domain
MDALAEVPEPGEDVDREARPQAPIWAEPRHLFFFRLGTLIGEGEQTPVEILALAESGAVVRTGQSLEEGSQLTIEVNSHHRFSVRVEWSSDSLAGLEFEDREHVRATLAGRDRAHPYRAPRLELAAEVLLRLGNTCLTARAKDVSEGGLKVELTEPAAVGEEASVIVPGMPPIAGRILWCRDGRAGISFERPLPFRCLIDCLTRQVAEQPAA